MAVKYTRDEIKQHRIEWVEALESGKFKQTSNELRRGNKYCCLGVACTISKVGKWKTGKIFDKGPSFNYETDTDMARMLLPDEVSTWLGIRGDDPWIGDLQASQWNDIRKANFKQIAAAARRQWNLR